MVILFFLLGVSAKHFIEEDSTTVSQNDTTGSATYIDQYRSAKQKEKHLEEIKMRWQMSSLKYTTNFFGEKKQIV